MAGFVIHLAIGKKYVDNHKNEIKNYDEFIKGCIAPDLSDDKSISHYGEKSSKTNLYNYLCSNNVDNDYERGYFLHLLSDYLFYNRYLTCFSKKYIYDDYDITNKQLIERYDIKVPEYIKEFIKFKDGDTKIINLAFAIKVIEEISKYNINEVIENVLKNPEDWIVYKKLIKIE